MSSFKLSTTPLIFQWAPSFGDTVDFPQDYLMKHVRNTHRYNKKMTRAFDSFLMKSYICHSHKGTAGTFNFRFAYFFNLIVLFLCIEYTNNRTQLLLLKTFAFQSKIFWLTSKKKKKIDFLMTRRTWNNTTCTGSFLLFSSLALIFNYKQWLPVNFS